MTKLLRVGLVAGLVFAASPALALDVVVSIKPLHSLVASVMGDTGSPHLIVRGAASPHTYSMRPSDAAALEKADVVFWIGHGLEAFLDKPLDAFGGKAEIVAIAEQPGLALLPQREGGPFEAHSHGDEDHDHDAEHDDHAHEQHAHEEHGHDALDMHLWLDPQNAAAAVGVIEDALAKADPGNAAAYAANADALRDHLAVLGTQIDAELAPVRGKPFIVFHDAYQYFEKRFGVTAAGSITVSPEVMPGAERIAAIRDRIASAGAACVFAEPQFEPRLVQTLIDGTSARAGVLDPEGGALTEGPDLYFDLMKGLSSSLAACLAGGG